MALSLALATATIDLYRASPNDFTLAHDTRDNVQYAHCTSPFGRLTQQRPTTFPGTASTDDFLRFQDFGTNTQQLDSIELPRPLPGTSSTRPSHEEKSKEDQPPPFKRQRVDDCACSDHLTGSSVVEGSFADDAKIVNVEDGQSYALADCASSGEETTEQVDTISDAVFVRQVKATLRAQSKWKTANVGRRQAKRILQLLEISKVPDSTEALFVSEEQAIRHLQPKTFFSGPIIVSNAQPLALQPVDQFLDEFYDDTAKIWIQDPGIQLARNVPHAREVSVAQVRARFVSSPTKSKHPWNCLEMAAHVEDGLRPEFLNSEDCRLLTKLKSPSTKDSASRRGFEPGWREVEKWALLAQGGALTEPHQDSHGYNTYITVNQGIIGFGWLSNPTAEERLGWRADPATYDGGRWRHVILRRGQTVFFPSGTVHFVFRLKKLGDTLAFGGHVLRCSRIVHWVETMLEEKADPNITNEELTVNAPAYLERVEKFLAQAIAKGQEEKWGGNESIELFLMLKEEFMRE